MIAVLNLVMALGYALGAVALGGLFAYGTRPTPWPPARHPRVAHFLPYWFNDSLAGIRRAARRRFKYIDQDGQCSADGVVFVKHWPLPRRDGFGWIWTGEYRGRGRFRREVRRRDPHPTRKLEDRPWSEIERLRSRRVGPSRRYLTAARHMRECAHHGLTMCLEAKGSREFEQTSTWRNVADLAELASCRVIVMTLMIGPTGPDRALARLKAAHRAGLPTVLLVHGWAKPHDWSTAWAPYVDAVWGRWA